nr:ABC transporter ATP-binding protein [Tropheryma whipplei]
MDRQGCDVLRGSVLSVSDLSVVYGDVVAMRDATFEVASGVVCGIIGMNGSGKSSLFNSIVGNVRPARGSISIFGLSPVAAMKRGMVAYAPQRESIDWNFPISVREVVMMGRYGFMSLSRRASQTDRDKVTQALEMTELVELADRQIGQLSGGQKKRAFVARAIAQGAKLLLLDEPFAGVDKKSEGMIVQLIRQLCEKGCCVLVSTHDLNTLHGLCNEAILVKNRILMHNTCEVVLRPNNLAMAFGLDPGYGTSKNNNDLNTFISATSANGVADGSN